MEYPTEIWDIVKEAVKRHKGRKVAFRDAVKRVRKHPAFQSFVVCLVDGAIEDLVDRCRHASNVKMRRAACVLPKVVSGNSLAVRAIADNLYLYNIGGNVLGNITKEELQAIAPSERERAAGHVFNARLCEKLIPLVPKGKTVQQAVNKTKLQSVWRDADRETGKAA